MFTEVKTAAELFSTQPVNHEVVLLSELALAEDWLKPEEDMAWAHLQSENCIFIK